MSRHLGVPARCDQRVRARTSAEGCCSRCETGRDCPISGLAAEVLRARARTCPSGGAEERVALLDGDLVVGVALLSSIASFLAVLPGRSRCGSTPRRGRPLCRSLALVCCASFPSMHTSFWLPERSSHFLGDPYVAFAWRDTRVPWAWARVLVGVSLGLGNLLLPLASSMQRCPLCCPRATLRHPCRSLYCTSADLRWFIAAPSYRE